jgi:uncharacterized protein YdgA (DUF945 family)
MKTPTEQEQEEFVKALLEILCEDAQNLNDIPALQPESDSDVESQEDSEVEIEPVPYSTNKKLHEIFKIMEVLERAKLANVEKEIHNEIASAPITEFRELVHAHALQADATTPDTEWRLPPLGQSVIALDKIAIRTKERIEELKDLAQEAENAHLTTICLIEALHDFQEDSHAY